MAHETGQICALAKIAQDSLTFVTTTLGWNTAHDDGLNPVEKHFQKALSCLNLILQGNSCNPKCVTAIVSKTGSSSSSTGKAPHHATAKGTGITKNIAKTCSPAAKGLQIKLIGFVR